MQRGTMEEDVSRGGQRAVLRSHGSQHHGGAGAWRGARGGLAPGDAGVCVERLGARRYGAGSVHWSRRGTLDKVLLFLNVFVVHESGL